MMRKFLISAGAAVAWSLAFVLLVYVAHATGIAFQNVEEAALMIWGAVLMNVVRIGWEAV